MRTTIKVMLTLLLAFAPLATLAADDHAMHRGGAAHEEVVDGVKATFRITSIADELKAKGIAVPKGLKETHHLAVEFKDARSGKPLVKGAVSVRVQDPAKAVAGKELVGMDGHFGADVEFDQPGRYGIMCKFILEDGKSRQARFWYEIK